MFVYFPLRFYGVPVVYPSFLLFVCCECAFRMCVCPCHPSLQIVVLIVGWAGTLAVSAIQVRWVGRRQTPRACPRPTKQSEARKFLRCLTVAWVPRRHPPRPAPRWGGRAHLPCQLGNFGEWSVDQARGHALDQQNIQKRFEPSMPSSTVLDGVAPCPATLSPLPNLALPCRYLISYF